LVHFLKESASAIDRGARIAAILARRFILVNG